MTWNASAQSCKDCWLCTPATDVICFEQLFPAHPISALLGPRPSFVLYRPAWTTSLVPSVVHFMLLSRQFGI